MEVKKLRRIKYSVVGVAIWLLLASIVVGLVAFLSPHLRWQ